MLLAQTDWEQEYKKLWQYDSKWAKKLKNDDGTWVKPKPGVINFLKKIAPQIQDASKKMGVPPEAIAGSILAENSLNVSTDDDIQEFLVYWGIAPKGEILGKSFSYGPGQLKFKVAREAENHMAKIEGRQSLSDDELSKELRMPGKVPYHVAAVLRKIQDDYKAQGFDISNQSEILTTVYNLGDSVSKARAAKENKTQPKMNYFGFFIKKNASSLAFLNQPAQTTPVPTNPEPAPVKVVKSLGKEAAAKVKKTPDKKVVVSESSTPNKSLVLAFKDGAALYKSPPSCPTGGYGSIDIKNKYNGMKSFPVNAIAAKGVGYKILAPGIDSCESENWKLIQLDNGEVGWIKDADLEANTEKVYRTVPECKKSPEALQCEASLKTSLATSIVNDKDKEMIYLKPFTRNAKVNFKHPDWSCAEPGQVGSDPNAGGIMGGYINGGYGGGTYLNPYPTDTHSTVSGIANSGSGTKPGQPQTIKEILAARGAGLPTPITKGKEVNTIGDIDKTLGLVAKKVKEIEKKYDAPMTDLKNPFRSLYFGMIYSNLQSCKERQENRILPCQMDIKKVKSFLDTLTLPDKFDAIDRELINWNINALSTNEPLIDKEAYKKIKSGSYGNNPYGSIGGYMGMGVGGFGGYSGGYLQGQYQLEEGDEKKWDIVSLENVMKSCLESVSKIEERVNNDKNILDSDKNYILQNIGSLKTMSYQNAINLIVAFKPQATDHQKEAWEISRPYLIQLTKVCLGIADAYDIKIENLDKASFDYSCYVNKLDAVDAGFGNVQPKDLFKSLVLSGQGSSEAAFQASSAYPNYIFGQIEALLTNSNPNLPQVGGMAGGIGGGYSPVAIFGNYCPNKTAEMIEQMLEANPCIKHVYVPSEWLVNRLNSLGKKVILRPFEEEDRFAVDVGGNQCQ